MKAKRSLIRALWVGGGLITLVAGLVLAEPTYWSIPTLFTAKIAFTLALVVMSASDWKMGLVPPALTLPLLAGGLGVTAMRLALAQDIRALPYWIAIYTLWNWKVIGGGDTKLLLGVFGLWPTLEMMWLQLMGLFVRALLILLWQYRGAFVAQIIHANAAFLTRGVSQVELYSRGHRVTWAYALVIGVYIWFLF